MAKYSDIKGFTVQTLSTDTVASQAGGGSWASGGALNTARTSAQGSGTSSSSAILGGGYKTPASPTYHAQTEIYNGTAWTEVNDLNQARFFGQGSGTTTAAIVIGGNNYATLVETWDGSSWTEVAEVNTGRLLGSSLGTTTAGIYAGGGPPGSGITNVESWNGSSWTETSYDLNTGKYYMWGTGNSTNAIVSGTPTTTEEFNGSSWTETTESSTDHRSGAASGLKTDALIWGGDNGPGYVVNTEIWNGSSWTELNNLSQGKAYTGGTENAPSGTASALSYGGSTPTQTTSTEEWDAPSTFTKQVEGQLFFNSTTNTFKETITDIPAATWASAPSLNTPAPANYARAQFGGGTSSNVAAGSNPNGTLCESFDGTSWSEFTEKSGGNTEKPGLGQSGTAGFVIGQNSNTAYVEEWNGSSWSEKADLNTGRNAMSTGGTITSGLVFGGETPQYDETESWNGSAWTEVADLNTGKAKAAGWGASNIDAISAVGFAPIHSPTYRKNTELWDGTSWTEVADTNDFHQSGGCSGFISTLGIVFAGDAQQPPGAGRTTKTELWNGTSWTEINDTSVAAMDSGFGPSGKASSAMFITGDTSSGRVNSTEMFDASLANKTITAS